jgi:hypothetical protein
LRERCSGGSWYRLELDRERGEIIAAREERHGKRACRP